MIFKNLGPTGLKVSVYVASTRLGAAKLDSAVPDRLDGFVLTLAAVCSFSYGGWLTVGGTVKGDPVKDLIKTALDK